VNESFFQPLLLCFKSDDFMDAFFAAAGHTTSAGLQKHVAATGDPGVPLKLFQPIHGRYYMICASLCCRISGFPDREPRLAEGERVSFVIRRLLNNEEYGWVAEEEEKGWHRVQNSSGTLLSNEERVPLFSTTAGNNRLIFSGYLPVTSRETYVPKPDESPLSFPQTDPRPDEYHETITRSLERLLQESALSEESAEQVSLFLLLDLSIFISSNAPKVYDALRGEFPVEDLNGNQQSLVAYLLARKKNATTLADAVVHAGDLRQQIEQLSGEDPLPLHYDLRDFSGLNAVTLQYRVLAPNVLTPYQAPGEPPQEPVPKFPMEPGDRYLVRCVYERPQCDPFQVWVSKPSETFEIASFFDPQAPARPLRIGLPVDVSIAGLRKFRKGVAFMMSKALRNKIARIIGKEKEVLAGDDLNSEGSATLGMMCSFSIPIITICAFILLLIIVGLLNIVFWWLPFFKICFPLKLGSSD
jgi:hypothetical protein